MCGSVNKAVAAGQALGYPLVLKAVGAELVHKTEQNAVRLGISNEADVRAAATDLFNQGEGVLVERMSENPLCELIIGVTSDPVIGLHLLVGFGGILAEIVRDSCIILIPAEADEIRQSILSLKAAPLLLGHRGQATADLDAVINAVIGVQKFALDHADKLIELDINPLIVKSDGAVAVDALIRLEK